MIVGFGHDFPELIGSMGDGVFTLFHIMISMYVVVNMFIPIIAYSLINLEKDTTKIKHDGWVPDTPGRAAGTLKIEM